jgi:hypothetical protein
VCVCVCTCVYVAELQSGLGGRLPINMDLLLNCCQVLGDFPPCHINLCCLRYAACKMGLFGYFATLATELADTGVRVTLCCPGPVAAAQGSAPRSVYGPTGLISTHAAKSEKEDRARMKPEVCDHVGCRRLSSRSHVCRV